MLASQIHRHNYHHPHNFHHHQNNHNFHHRHCPVATRVRRGNTLDGRENSIGEEEEASLEDEENVRSNGKGGNDPLRGVADEKGIDISKRAPSHTISKSCSPPRYTTFFRLLFFSSAKKLFVNETGISFAKAANVLQSFKSLQNPPFTHKIPKSKT